MRFFTRFDINLVERFDMVGDKRYRYNQEMFASLSRKLVQFRVERGLQPLSRPYAALIAEVMRRPPPAGAGDKADCLLNLMLVRIAAFYKAQRHPMRAEDDIHGMFVDAGKFPVCNIDVFYQRLDIDRKSTRLNSS